MESLSTSSYRRSGSVLRDGPAEVARLAGDTSIESHDRYLQVYKLIHERDKLLANAFNDFRRSTAELQLLIMKRHGMLTDEECAQFSPEIRAMWTALLER